MTPTPIQDSNGKNFNKGQSNRKLVILYSISVFFYWISMYIYMPTLPIYIQSIAGDLVIVGTILSMYGLWQGLIRLPMGIGSDWLGKYKPFIITGYIFSAAGALLMGRAENSLTLLIGRSFTGVAAATWVPLVVAFSNLFPPAQAVQATALLTAINSTGRVLATASTGTLNQIGGYQLAFNLAIVSAGAALLAILLIKEPKRSRMKISLGGLRILANRYDVMLPSILDAVTQLMIWSGPYSFFPIVARNLGASEVMISLLVSMYLAVFMLGNFSVSFVVKKIKPVIFTFIGFGLLALSLIIASQAETYVSIFIAQLIAGLASGLTYPTLMGMSIEHVQNYERSTAMGLHQTIYSIGMFVGPWLGGILAAAYGMETMFILFAFSCGIFGMLGTYWLALKQKREPIYLSET